MSQINSGTILLAFVAILMGLAGTYGLRAYMREEPVVITPEPPPKKPELLTIPLASRDIASGTQITLDDVALYKMTREEVKKTISASSFMMNPKQIIGKILLNDLKRGHPFNTPDFFPTGKSPGIANRLRPGLRAMTIVLIPTNALIGFAGPGQRVDVLFHYGESATEDTSSKQAVGFYPQHFDFNPPGSRNYYGNRNGGHDSGGILAGFQSATSTLVQDAEILALGRQSMPTQAASGLAEDERVAVTLAVNPKEAELLRVAYGHGELSLTLRGPTDNARIRLLNPVTLNQIIDVKSSLHEMEIYRGKQISRIQFSGGQSINRRTFGTDIAAGANPSGTGNPAGYSSPVPPISQVPTYVPVWPMQPMPYPDPRGAATGQAVSSPSKTGDSSLPTSRRGRQK